MLRVIGVNLVKSCATCSAYDSEFPPYYCLQTTPAVFYTSYWHIKKTTTRKRWKYDSICFSLILGLVWRLRYISDFTSQVSFNVWVNKSESKLFLVTLRKLMLTNETVSIKTSGSFPNVLFCYNSLAVRSEMEPLNTACYTTRKIKIQTRGEALVWGALVPCQLTFYLDGRGAVFYKNVDLSGS